MHFSTSFPFQERVVGWGILMHPDGVGGMNVSASATHAGPLPSASSSLSSSSSASASSALSPKSAPVPTNAMSTLSPSSSSPLSAPSLSAALPTSSPSSSSSSLSSASTVDAATCEELAPLAESRLTAARIPHTSPSSTSMDCIWRSSNTPNVCAWRSRASVTTSAPSRTAAVHKAVNELTRGSLGLVSHGSESKSRNQ